MSTTDLKNSLLNKIEQIQTDELLEQLLGIIELEAIKSEVFKIPKEYKAGIEEGLQQIKDGKVVSHSEVMDKYKSWR